MRTLLAILTLCWAGCAAHTTIYAPDGKTKLLNTSGDITKFRYYKGPKGSITVTADKMDHSAPTLAAGKAGSDRAMALGTAFATSGIGAIIKGL